MTDPHTIALIAHGYGVSLGTIFLAGGVALERFSPRKAIAQRVMGYTIAVVGVTVTAIAGYGLYDSLSHTHNITPTHSVEETTSQQMPSDLERLADMREPVVLPKAA